MVSKFEYTNDAIGRRTARLDSGTAFASTLTNAFGYNPRSEVTEAVMGDDTYGYAYDPIGNRIVTTKNTETTEYVANNLNQYAQISAPSVPSVVHPTHDADGNMTFLPSTSGGGAGGEGWYFQWNGENRLILASNAQHIVTYAYDHRGRMVRKDVSVWDEQLAAYSPQLTAEFLWDGWNLVGETVAVGSGSTQSVATNYYTWGRDLSGRLQDAGGVGGLLAVTTVSSDTSCFSPLIYYPTCDANGNVTEYLSVDGTIAARYAYSPFGETTSQSGDLAETFTHRFSTKPFDAETSLVMYQLRPYAPSLGRWATRDPIEEKGGLNLYEFVRNDPVNRLEYLGLASMLLHDGVETQAKYIRGWIAMAGIANIVFSVSWSYSGSDCCEPPKKTNSEQYGPHYFYNSRSDSMYQTWNSQGLGGRSGLGMPNGSSPGGDPRGTFVITFVWSKDTSGVPEDLNTTPFEYDKHGATWKIHHSYPWRESPFPPFDKSLSDFDGKTSGKILTTVEWNTCGDNNTYTFKAVDESGNDLKEGFTRREEP